MVLSLSDSPLMCWFYLRYSFDLKIKKKKSTWFFSSFLFLLCEFGYSLSFVLYLCANLKPVTLFLGCLIQIQIYLKFVIVSPYVAKGNIHSLIQYPKIWNSFSFYPCLLMQCFLKKVLRSYFFPSPKFICWSPKSNVTWDTAFKDVIKVKWHHRGGDWCFL